jgi:hypothetical protein
MQQEGKKPRRSGKRILKNPENVNRPPDTSEFVFPMPMNLQTPPLNTIDISPSPINQYTPLYECNDEYIDTEPITGSSRDPESMPLYVSIYNAIFDRFAGHRLEGMTAGDDLPSMAAITGMLKAYLKISMEYILKSLMYLFSYIPYIMHKLPDSFSKIFSENKASYNDRESVSNHFMYLIAVAVAYIVTYNWFYLFFFERIGKKMDITNMDISALSEKIGAFQYVFYYLVVPLHLLNACINFFIHFIGKKIKNMKLLFGVLFVILLLLIINYGSIFLDMFYEGFSFSSGKYRPFYIAMMVVYGVYAELSEFFRLPKNLTDPAELVVFANKFTSFSIISKIITLVIFIFRIMFSISFSWVCSIFISVFILFRSFLSMFFDSENGINVAKTIFEINTFLEDNSSDVFSDEKAHPCNSNDTLKFSCKYRGYVGAFYYFFDLITNYKYLFHIFYKYMLEIIMVFIIFKSLYDYMYEIKNGKLKSALIWFCSILIISIVCLCIYKENRIESGKLAEKEYSIFVDNSSKLIDALKTPMDTIIQTNEASASMPNVNDTIQDVVASNNNTITTDTE